MRMPAGFGSAILMVLFWVAAKAMHFDPGVKCVFAILQCYTYLSTQLEVTFALPKRRRMRLISAANSLALPPRC
jgi:hypothetical protein